jgi:recombination protein RecT
MEEEFARAMPAGEARQFVRDAMTCLQTIDKLDRCEPRSVLGALMTSAQLGLRPAVLGHAWPLPFWDRNVQRIGEDGKPMVDGRGNPVMGGHRAQLVIGYQGYTHLGYESGKVKAVRGAVVYEADDFEFDEGSGLPPIHKRPKLGTQRGQVIGYYAVIETVFGGVIPYVMDVPEVLRFRDEFAPRGKPDRETGVSPVVGPWRNAVGTRPFDGMSLKTCLRYAFKTAPKSPQLARAEVVDGTVRLDASVLSEPAAVSHHPAIEAPQQPAAPVDPDPTDEPGFGEPGFRG